MTLRHFHLENARRAARVYYRELFHAVELGDGTVEKVVTDAMQKSITIWQELMAIKTDFCPLASDKGCNK